MLEHAENFIHNKSVYSLVDCLSDFGGLIEIIFFFGMITMKPIKFHSYTMHMIKKLFFAKTKDSELFKKPKTILKGYNLTKKIGYLIGDHFNKTIMQ